MAKNIVICSDGTGNRGGKTAGTNVWRLYNAVDLRANQREQVTHYDDGVGTEDNKYVKIVTGALGLGFSKNLKRAYKFLVRTYEQGDHIYMFGFSRGAYTVRALAAFVANCGIIVDGISWSEQELDERIDQLARDYHANEAGQEVGIFSEVETTGPVPIKFVGVWDTVSALGLPFDIALERLTLGFFKFRFADQNLSPKIDHGCQALSIDDARKTFRPVVWNEPEGQQSPDGSKRPRIEQAWFAGVHSNVGGGYPKQGMSYVPLEWMISKVEWPQGDGSGGEAEPWGLIFEDGFAQEVRDDANVNGKLYDSRSGAAAYYRYQPRDIRKLYHGEGVKIDKVQIHDSVFDRIDRRTGDYNPGNIPADLEVEVVATAGTPGAGRVAKWQGLVDNSRRERAEILLGAEEWINKREALHLAFVLLNILVATALAQFLLNRPDKRSGCNSEVVDCGGIWELILHYGVPILAAVVIVIAMVKMASLGRKKKARIGRVTLCLVALAVLATALLAPQGLLFGVIPVWCWAIDLFEFVLPDILAGAIVYFIGHFAVWVAAAVAALLVMLFLRCRYRRKCTEIFEQACDLLRSRNGDGPAEASASR